MDIDHTNRQHTPNSFKGTRSKTTPKHAQSSDINLTRFSPELLELLNTPANDAFIQVCRMSNGRRCTFCCWPRFACSTLSCWQRSPCARSRWAELDIARRRRVVWMFTLFVVLGCTAGERPRLVHRALTDQTTAETDDLHHRLHVVAALLCSTRAEFAAALRARFVEACNARRPSRSSVLRFLRTYSVIFSAKTPQKHAKRDQNKPKHKTQHSAAEQRFKRIK